MNTDQNIAERAITPGNRLGSLTISAVLIVISAAAILQARSFPSIGLDNDVGAGRFPIIFATVLILLCLGLIVDTLRRPVTADPDAPSAGELKKRLGNVIVGLVLVVVGAMSIEWVGYVPATFVYLLAAIYVMGFRHLLWTPLTAAALTAALYCAFSIGLNVPLPVGALFE